MGLKRKKSDPAMSFLKQLFLKVIIVHQKRRCQFDPESDPGFVNGLNFLSFGGHATLQDIQQRAREVFANVQCAVVMNLDTLRTAVLHFFLFSFSLLGLACLMRCVKNSNDPISA